MAQSRHGSGRARVWCRTQRWPKSLQIPPFTLSAQSRLPYHSRYNASMERPSCAECGRLLSWGVAWVTHRGGPLCDVCVDDDVFEELERLYQLGWWRAPLCEGGCDRIVIDRRRRGQSIRACSSVCRRFVRNELRRMERRAQRPVAPIKCVACKADILVTRSDKRYCSARCRVRAHRQRARTAPKPPVPVGARGVPDLGGQAARQC